MKLLSLNESPPPTGHRTAFSAVDIPATEQLHQIGNHRWRPSADVSLSLDDVGSLQGATLVERLRTIAGQPLDVDEHLARLRNSADELGIQWPLYLTAELVHQCASRNRSVHSAPDFGIVVLLTPGLMRRQPLGSAPTVIVHSVDLPWPQLAHWYQYGQPLVISSNCNVPDKCWSPHLKTRSRMHYFLADQQARGCGLPHAGAVMLSTEGMVTESSVANLMMIDDQQLVAPPIDTVLQGLSLRRTVRLAEKCGISVRYEPITLADAKEGDGILLTGSSGCLWPASQLGDAVYDNPTAHPIYQQLHRAWVEELGLDFAAQAIELNPDVRL